MNPESGRFSLNLGFELLAIGRTKEAIEQFEKVIEANPDYAHAHLTRLGILHRSKDG